MKHFEVINNAFAGGYAVDSLGNVLSKKGWILKPQLINSGYLAVTLRVGNRSYHITVHQIVWVFFNNLDVPQINHIDGNKLNNCPQNLEQSTQSHNNKHAYRTGLRSPNHGAKSGRSDLTDQDVIDMRSLVADGHRQKEIAPLYGIARNTLSYIINRRTWTHIWGSQKITLVLS